MPPQPQVDCRGLEPGWMDTPTPDAPSAMSELVFIGNFGISYSDAGGLPALDIGEVWNRDWTLALR